MVPQKRKNQNKIYFFWLASLSGPKLSTSWCSAKSDSSKSRAQNANLEAHAFTIHSLMMPLDFLPLSRIWLLKPVVFPSQSWWKSEWIGILSFCANPFNPKKSKIRCHLFNWPRNGMERNLKSVEWTEPKLERCVSSPWHCRTLSMESTTFYPNLEVIPWTPSYCKEPRNGGTDCIDVVNRGIDRQRTVSRHSVIANHMNIVHSGRCWFEWDNRKNSPSVELRLFTRYEMHPFWIIALRCDHLSRFHSIHSAVVHGKRCGI